MSGRTSFNSEDAKKLQMALGELYESLWQQWKMVMNQWENLKLTWDDEQFKKFEPKFLKLSEDYDQVIRDCDNYRAFLQKQIQLSDSLKLRLISFFENSISTSVVITQSVDDEQFKKFEPKFLKLSEDYDQVIRDCDNYRAFPQKQIQLSDSLKLRLISFFENSISNSVVITQLVASLIGLVSTTPIRVLDQGNQTANFLMSESQDQKNTLCPIDSSDKSPISELYEQQIPKIARTVPIDEQLEESYSQEEERKRKKREKEEEMFKTMESDL